MSVKSDVVKFKCTIQFPNFEKKDVYNGRETNYCVTLGHLSEQAVEAIEEAFGPKDFNGNVRVKFNEKNDFGKYMKVNSKFPIIPIDVDNVSFEGRTDKIGYGSQAIALLKADGTGSPRLAKLVITELAEWEEPEAVSLEDAL